VSPKRSHAGSKLKRRENAPAASTAATDGAPAGEEDEGSGATEGDDHSTQAPAEDEEPTVAKATVMKKEKKDKKKAHSSRRRKKEDKSLPLMASTKSRNSLSVRVNGEAIDDVNDEYGTNDDNENYHNREGGGETRHHREGGEAKGNTEKLRKNLTRSGSMVELKKQLNHIDRQ
jgi:hypothetical protein